jgi:hypothetical protein
MFYIKWALTLIIWASVALFLHYELPRYDVVRITNTETRRIEAGGNAMFWANPGTSGATNQISRDIFFVDAFLPNGRPRVYRNEDTGWGWPPYFKLDSANLQARLNDAVSTQADPQWMVLRYYGMRVELITIYPNVLNAWPASGPDERVTNWFRIVFLSLFVLVFGALWIRWRRFREAKIDPALAATGDWFAETFAAIGYRWRRFKAWLAGS